MHLMRDLPNMGLEIHFIAEWVRASLRDRLQSTDHLCCSLDTSQGLCPIVVCSGVGTAFKKEVLSSKRALQKSLGLLTLPCSLPEAF